MSTAKIFSVPVQRKHGGPPITRLQKWIADLQSAKQETRMANGGADQLETKIGLTNNYNLQYIGPAMVGTPLQDGGSNQFVYDTGSGFLTITTTGCTDCSSIAYNPSLSSTVGTSSYTETQLIYGSATLNGQMASDKVCTVSNAPTTCVTDFSFFEIKSQTGL